MAGSPNSCRTWQRVLNKNQTKINNNICFEPSNKQCASHEVKEVVSRDPIVVANFLKPESPVRRLIDIRDCSKFSNKFTNPEKCCTLHELQKESFPGNLCSAKCRPQSTTLHSKEYRQRSPPKRDYKHSCSFNDGSIIGRAFPMKFRIRRQFSECFNCDKDLKLRETVTDANNIILLSNCCDLEIYSEKQMDNWHKVRVAMISGNEKLSKKTISEICKQTPKIEPTPVKVVKIASIVDTKRKSKKKKKKKGAKGKKDKKKKK